MMKEVAQRATLTLIPTQIPTVPINRQRTKTWKTRTMMKTVKVGHLIACVQSFINYCSLSEGNGLPIS